MGNLSFQTISKRAIKGAFSLTLRRIALQAISFITINLLLARFLPVATLGIFNIGVAIIAFFSFFSDIGLAAAIIQKKTEVTAEDLKTTFTIQQLLVFGLFLVVFFGAPFFAKFYGLSNDGVWLIRSLAGAFVITSFKVIPSVLLERELRFAPLVTVEVLETLIFNLVLIFLVMLKFDLSAFSYAALLRAILGTSVIYMIAPWKIGLGISKSAAMGLLSFGVPYQANALLALLKDRLVPLLIARMVGAAGIGYITWAQNLAFLPLEVMNIVIRVSFPTFSRMQDDEIGLKKSLEKALFLTTLFLYPMLFGLLAISPGLVKHVVSAKWEPALPAFYLFSISTFWATISTTFTNALNAIGKIKTTLKLMIFWTILTWILTPVLTLWFGFLGVAISSAVISFTSVATIILIKRFIKVEILKSIWSPLLASILMSALTFYLSLNYVTNLFSLILVISIGIFVYIGLISFFAGSELKANLKGLKNAFSD